MFFVFYYIKSIIMNVARIKNSIYSGVIFFGTIMVLSVGYGALVWGLSLSDKVGSGSWLTATAWNRIVDGVLDLSTRLTNIEIGGGVAPSGAIMAFNLASCPNGWSSFTSANGRVIVWAGSDGQWNTYTLLNVWGEARHTLTTAEMPSHTHGFSIGTTDDNVAPWNVALLQLWDNGPFSYANFTTAAAGGSQSHENRMPYLALLYCVKN